MTTQIFANYQAFTERTDKSINGVSPALTVQRPDWEDMNATNTGCWNCIACEDCFYCKDCDGCTLCNNCTTCENCLGCYNCDTCYTCTACINCTSCANCDEGDDLVNGVKV